MILEQDLKTGLASYLGGQISLVAFEDWLAVESWNAHQDSLPEAVRLVGAIELRLSEHSSGHLSGEELAQELKAIFVGEPVQFSFAISTFVPMRIEFNVQPHRIYQRPQFTSASSVVNPSFLVAPLAVPA